MSNFFRYTLHRIKPKDYLIRKINPNNIDEEFENERKEFYGTNVDHKERILLSQNSDWKRFISKLHIGDELWFYRFPNEFWKQSQGQQGYVIIREAKMVDKFITFQN